VTPVGLGSLVLSIVAVIFSPLLVPCCLAPFLGLVAGFVTGLFDKPASNNAVSKSGAISGAVGSIGAVLGQVIGAVVNSFIMGPEGAAQFARSMGLPGSGSSGFEGGYWFGVVGGAVCFSMFDVLLMAGFGALGALLWWQFIGKNAVLPPPPVE
jgi:hypothetical protein